MLIGQVCGGPSKQRDSRPNNQLAILLTLAKEGELEGLLKDIRSAPMNFVFVHFLAFIKYHFPFGVT